MAEVFSEFGRIMRPSSYIYLKCRYFIFGSGLRGRSVICWREIHPGL